MKEETRLEKIKKANERKKEMLILTKEKVLLSKLAETSIVKEYLELEARVGIKEIVTPEEINERIFGERNSNCEHDIYFYLGSFRTKYDFGPESRDTTYHEFDEEKIEYYSYACLECWEEIRISKEENNEFRNNHRIIDIGKKFITYQDYRLYQKEYFKLLYANKTENAYKRLLELNNI